MTRAIALLAALLALGCGKYGPPVRASVAAGSGGEPAGAAHSTTDCEDSEHEHAAEATP